MQLGMELNQNQTLKLALTPELRQSIHILQYSSLELIDFLHQQAVENPILDVEETSSNDFIAQNYDKTPMSQYNSNNDNGYNLIDNYYTMNETLEDHLLEQIMTLPNMTSLQQTILKFLIRSLNEYGFLEIEPTIVARIFSVTLEEVEESIDILQSLNPIGVGARNLADCLLIQVQSQSYDNTLAYQIIEKHLEDLAEKRYRKIAKSYNVNVQEIQEAADYIKTLNPRPCSDFHYEITPYMIPDVIVDHHHGEYVIIVNDRMMPNLSINQFYKNNLGNDQLTDNFLQEKYHEAMMLMNGIEQRKVTLYKVTHAILGRQKDFLQYGISGLKPMTLKDIAKQSGFHESTISRATNNKYIQTQHGIFKLKNLFTAGLNRNNSLETDSSVTIKEQIKALIDKENKQKPLSDQIIVELLEPSGILIARRTVAKYREEIGIPSSSKRRRY